MHRVNIIMSGFCPLASSIGVLRRISFKVGYSCKVSERTINVPYYPGKERQLEKDMHGELSYYEKEMNNFALVFILVLSQKVVNC
jgi:hypothetical protein